MYRVRVSVSLTFLGVVYNNKDDSFFLILDNIFGDLQNFFDYIDPNVPKPLISFKSTISTARVRPDGKRIFCIRVY